MNDSSVHLVEELLVTLLLVLEVVILVTSLLRLSNKDITVTLIVEHNLLNRVVSLEQAFLVGELGNVDRSLGVVRGELLVNGLVLLLLGEVFLIVAELVGLHVEKLIIVLEVLGDLVLDDLFLTGFLAFLGGSWWHL